MGPRGEAGPPGQLPSIEQIMPWLHMVFDAWEDHRRHREQEAREAAEQEAAQQEALAAFTDADLGDLDDDEGRRDKDEKKKKKHKDKKK
jgi:hypothetical protein